jgi:VCBS repeat-containing protein
MARSATAIPGRQHARRRDAGTVHRGDHRPRRRRRYGDADDFDRRRRPTPVADVDSVREEGPLVADGNVLTGSGGSDANATDGAADTPGADGFAISGVAFGATAGTIGAPLAGAFGSLVLGANGNYVYTLNNQSAAVQALGVNESLTETFTYTVTDGDGDARSTTLTITINGTNDRPTIAAGAATVSEEGLAAGNPDAVGLPSDGSNSATATGQLAIADIDGDALSVTLGAPAGSFTSHGQPIGWSLSSDGHVLTGTAGGAPSSPSPSPTMALIRSRLPARSIIPMPMAKTCCRSRSRCRSTTASLGRSTLTISVEDDSPLITSAPVVGSAILIDETAGASPLSSGDPLVATSAAAMISAAVSFGADGAGAPPPSGFPCSAMARSEARSLRGCRPRLAISRSPSR